LSLWFDDLRLELESSVIGENVEACEDELNQFGQQRETTLSAGLSTQAEGEQLLQQLK